MVKINFSASGATGIVTALQATYAELETKIGELNKKKESLSNCWSAAEATRFSTNLESVTTAYEKFKTKYNGYLSFLNSVIKAYQEDEASFVAAIKSIAPTEQ
jgi:flagellar hook-basal body complex protein FliE